MKPAAEKAAGRISSEADQLGREARPLADKASDNIQARARQAGEAARPAADNASQALKKGADDASGQFRLQCSLQLGHCPHTKPPTWLLTKYPSPCINGNCTDKPVAYNLYIAYRLCPGLAC